MELLKKTLILPFAFTTLLDPCQLQAMKQPHNIFDASSPKNFLASIANKIDEDGGEYFSVIVQLRQFFIEQKQNNPDESLLNGFFQYAVENLTDKRSMDLIQTILLAVDDCGKFYLKTQAHWLLERTFKISNVYESFEKKLLDQDRVYDKAILMMLRVLKDYNIPIIIKRLKFDLDKLVKKARTYNNDFDQQTALREILEFFKSGFINTSGTESTLDEVSRSDGMNRSGGIKIIYPDNDLFTRWLQLHHLRKSL